MEGLSVRRAREADLDELGEIHAASYPAPGGHERHARSWVRNPFGGLECVRVVEKSGAIVGGACLYSIEVWIGGRRVPIGGIGSVAVAPEARRAGVATFLLDQLHAEIASERGALALLYPFQQRFYARRGYASVSPLVSLEIAISALDSRALAPADGFSTIHLEGARVGEARALYDAIGMRTSGRIVRSESRWTKIFADEELHFMGVVSKAGTLEGYVSFSYEGGPFGPEQKLVVEELTSAEDAATSALFAALSAQRHQVASVELSVPYGDSLAFAFEDAAGPRRAPDGMAHRLGVLCTGPMVRMIDARRALSLRGYAADGDLTFACTDRRETLRLSVEGKEGHAEDVAARADIELTSGTLASIAASGLRPVQAAELGLLRGVPRALDLAEQMFSGPRFQCLDPF